MSDTLNRRQFINRSAIGAVTAATAMHVARAQNSPSDRIVVGVMGLSRGLSLASIFAAQPNVEVRYVCDADSNRVAGGVAAVEKAGAAAPKGITDFRQILDDKEVDVLACALLLPGWNAVRPVQEEKDVHALHRQPELHSRERQPHRRSHQNPDSKHRPPPPADERSVRPHGKTHHPGQRPCEHQQPPGMGELKGHGQLRSSLADSKAFPLPDRTAIATSARRRENFSTRWFRESAT